MEKFKTYSTAGGKCLRIDLHKNFRSRKEVLDGVNFLFYQIMGEALGKVEYDDAAALYPGASFLRIRRDRMGNRMRQRTSRMVDRMRQRSDRTRRRIRN